MLPRRVAAALAALTALALPLAGAEAAADPGSGSDAGADPGSREAGPTSDDVTGSRGSD